MFTTYSKLASLLFAAALTSMLTIGTAWSNPDDNEAPQERNKDIETVVDAVEEQHPRGTEKGAVLLEDAKTGKRRTLTGRDAGRGEPRRFRFKFRRRPSERIVAMGHSHPKGNSRRARRENNNGPSRDDQETMNQSGAPQVIVGPDVTVVLYRENGRDRVRVISGDRDKLPDMSEQGIVVDE